MKKTITINDSKLNKGIKHLVGHLQIFGTNAKFFEINYDLIGSAMPGFFAGKTFASFSIKRKKDLFNQFVVAKSVLDLMQEFVSDHPFLDASTIQNLEFNKDVENLLSFLETFGESGDFLSFNNELLEMAFTEFIASKTFKDSSDETRKGLIGQFAILKSVFNLLSNYVLEIKTVKEDNRAIANASRQPVRIFHISNR